MGTGRDDATPGGGSGGSDLVSEVPGGAALIRHFGRVPDFDGAEILKLVLDPARYSTLCVHGQVTACDGGGPPAAGDSHAAVSFVMGEIVDLRLDGFDAWGRIGGLILRRAADRPERRGRHGPAPASGDVEIELLPNLASGLSGYIRARTVEIVLEPGKPAIGSRQTGDDAWLPALVGSVLRLAWDPLALAHLGSGGVYDRYVPEFVDATLDATVSEDALVAHLARIEVGTMGLTLASDRRVRAARGLLGLRDARRPGFGEPVEQWSNPDGTLCLRIVETRDGLYAYEQRILRQEGDGDRRRLRWEDVGTGRSGLFATAGAAEREARYVVGWLPTETARSIR